MDKDNQIIRQALAERYPMPEKIRFLRRWALYDLYHGPISTHPDSPYNPDPEVITSESWPGFHNACKELDDWFNLIPSTLYYDRMCGQVNEQFYSDPDDDYDLDIVELDRRLVKELIFGKLKEYM